MNEYIKALAELFLPLYVFLFNKVLCSIKHIFKNKGSPNDSDNYRPITILSCLGKLFTSVLNNRLSTFLKDNVVLSENQAGFRKD